MSSSRHRRDSDARRDSYDDYQRRDSYQKNGYADGYGGGYDRDGYGSRDYYDDKVTSSTKSSHAELPQVFLSTSERSKVGGSIDQRDC